MKKNLNPTYQKNTFKSEKSIRIWVVTRKTLHFTGNDSIVKVLKLRI